MQRCSLPRLLLTLPSRAFAMRASNYCGVPGESSRARLMKIQSDISEGRLLRDGIKSVSAEIISMLRGGSLGKNDLQAIAQVLQLLSGSHTCYYNQEFMDSLSAVLLKTEDENVLCSLLPPFLSSCRLLRYYSRPLFTHAGKFVVDNTENFSSKQLDAIVHACARLNHHVPHLVPAVESSLMKRPESVPSCVFWNLAWAGMVFSEYPKEMLARILTDKYIIEWSWDMADDFLIMLFQLKISLNRDCPDLKLGLGWDNHSDLKQWGVCRSGMKGVSNRMLRKCYAIKLRQYYSRGRSTFGMKVHTAIKSTLGGSAFAQFDALSLSGYILDFEVLVDKDNAPVPIPLLWKRRASQTLAASIGEESARRRKLRDNYSPEDLVKAMRDVEGTEREGDVSGFEDPSLGSSLDAGLVNLASDWGTKFAKPPVPVARRLVVEANGPSHYAQNCDHPLGNTVLKTKHLQHLGWDVVNVNYRDWMHLKSQEEKAKYMHSILCERGIHMP